jgi:hypothetical protein
MGAIRLSVAIMTHPRRVAMAAALARSLHGLPSLAVDPEPDGPPSALRSAVPAWDAVPEWATHHLVLQDDVLPAPDLLATARAAAEELPDAALAFYTHWSSWNGARTRVAARAGRGWSELIRDEYVPTVALLLPRPAALDFAGFARTLPAVAPDDEAMAIFVRRQRLPAYVRVPNAVDHGAGVTTLAGDGFPARPHRSACFLPAARDGSRPAGILRGAEVPFLAHLALGEVSVMSEALPGLAGAGHWLDACWGLGLDERLVWDGYHRSSGGLPADARGVMAASGGRLLSSLWLTAYLEGAVCSDLPGPAPEPEVARRATESLVLGGLVGRLPEPVLRSHLDGLTAFADAAILAGGQAPRGERTRLASTWILDF